MGFFFQTRVRSTLEQASQALSDLQGGIAHILDTIPASKELSELREVRVHADLLRT